MKMKIVTATIKTYFDGVKDDWYTLYTDRIGDIENWGINPPISKMRRRWNRLMAIKDLIVVRTWCRIGCKILDHDWDHRESDNPEVGFWCESWCKRCGHSTGRRWM